ncbi:SpoIIE family protein phosphatase [Chitinispirillales bacterium ANBcel5]|uniref:ATP-binding SpoIIE family protein phosphatase n=1 Tax=Cellulosispirillum alkaliphilum TaxID=3039283 RepID=UPI002A56EEC4|nr:SpoIIE family protein phosphatase [Chitinispirillales bacterium ANBcel5]
MDREPVSSNTLLRSRLKRLLRYCRYFKRTCAQIKKENENLKKENRSINTELKVIKENLKTQDEILEEEKNLVKSIHSALTPSSLPDPPGLKVFALSIPHSEVGGDYYDFLVTPYQKTALLMYDVRGSGRTAAMIGGMAKILFIHALKAGYSPSEVFYYVNEELGKYINDGYFLTAFLSLYDRVSGKFIFSNAGHVAPYLYRKESAQLFSLNTEGTLIGHSAIKNEVSYREKIIRLDKGDKLLLYTDGLSETIDTTGRPYSSQLEKIVQHSAKLDVRSIVECILSDFNRFKDSSARKDDIAIAAIELCEPEAQVLDSGFIPADEPDMVIIHSYGQIQEVASVVLRKMDEADFADSVIKRTKVCIYELLNNAIKHGNRNDLSKKVYMLYKVDRYSLRLSVSDEGKGFDYRDLPNPLKPENLARNHGRGIFLIKKYMDEVQFNRAGNRVFVKKFRKR